MRSFTSYFAPASTLTDSHPAVRTAALFLALAAGLAGSPPCARAADRDLRGIDLEGRLHRLHDVPGCRGTIVVFLATGCPISNRCLPLLDEIAGEQRPRPAIRVFGVISSPHVTREAAAAHSRKFEPQFPILFDASGDLRTQLQPTHTPQAFLISPAGETLYSGALDDRFAAVGQARPTVTRNYLKDAVADLLKNQKVRVPRTTPVGCPLESPAKESADAPVTFNRDVAPILFTHCGGCHRPGASGPFPLLTYQDAVEHAAQIGHVTAAGLMPPWKPARDFGRFRDEAGLSAPERKLLADWVAGGKPEGPAADKPTPPAPAGGWHLGPPDVILEMPQAFTVPATGDDVHQHFVIPTGLDRNVLVSAIEFQPGNAAAVHHAVFYLDDAGAARKLEAQNPDVGYAFGPGPHIPHYATLRSWLPGQVPHRLPEGMGCPLRQGTDLVIEIHYQPTGRAETDRSRVGLYFAPPSAKRMVLEIQVRDTTLAIPAGATRHHHRASYTLPARTTLLDVSPHMHFLGRETRAVAHLPNGETKPLIWIKDWDFNWQGQYVFHQPLQLPAGTRIECDFYYDNSTGNARNPHNPPQPVFWGDRSKDEMGMCYFQYTCDTAADLRRTQKHHYLARQEDRPASALEKYALGLKTTSAPPASNEPAPARPR